MPSKIVSTQTQAEENIRRFRNQLEGSSLLVDRASYARAWYGYRDAEGEWCFGPSKFIGYVGMTATEYLNDDARDGRQTERKLAEWFTAIDESDDLYSEMKGALSAFLAEFGKVPSAKMRINVAKSYLESQPAAQDGDAERELGDLIIAVAKRLSSAERKRILSAL
tara:strand:+ start:3499 stop:3996 length:498 start_codon:yes stop_codon:yes gene_type:complete